MLLVTLADSVSTSPLPLPGSAGYGFWGTAEKTPPVPHSSHIFLFKSSFYYSTLIMIVLSPQKLGLIMHQIIYYNWDYTQHIN